MVYTSPDVHIAVHDVLHVGEVVHLKSKKYQKELEVESLRELNGVFTIKFRGIDNINDALRLKGYSMYHPNHHPEDMEEENPTGGITGYVVKDTGGEVWGTVEDLDTATLNQLLEIRGNDPDETFYVPFSEAIVKHVDHAGREIIIDPPEGLKDLNLS